MGTYEAIFDKGKIYDCLFLKVNSVLEYKNLVELNKNKPDLCDTWCSLSTEYAKKQNLTIDEYYERYAPYYPEYSKIVAVTVGGVELVGNSKDDNS